MFVVDEFVTLIICRESWYFAGSMLTNSP